MDKERGFVISISLILLAIISAIFFVYFQDNSTLISQEEIPSIDKESIIKMASVAMEYDSEKDVSCIKLRGSESDIPYLNVVFYFSDSQEDFLLSSNELPKVGEVKNSCFQLTKKNSPLEVKFTPLYSDPESSQLITKKPVSNVPRATSSSSSSSGSGSSSGGSSSSSSSDSSSTSSSSTPPAANGSTPTVNNTNSTTSTPTVNNTNSTTSTPSNETNKTSSGVVNPLTCPASYYLFEGSCVPLIESNIRRVNYNFEKIDLKINWSPAINEYANIDTSGADIGLSGIINSILVSSSGEWYLSGYFSESANFSNLVKKTYEERNPNEVCRDSKLCAETGGMLCEDSVDSFIGKFNFETGEWNWVKTVGSNPVEDTTYNVPCYKDSSKKNNFGAFLFSRSNLGMDSTGNIVAPFLTQGNIIFEDNPELNVIRPNSIFKYLEVKQLNFISKISKTGNWNFIKLYNSTKINPLGKTVFSSDGQFVYSLAGDSLLSKIDLNSGNILFSKNYNQCSLLAICSNEEDFLSPKSIALDRYDNLYLTGSRDKNDVKSIFVAKYFSNGTLSWIKSYGEMSDTWGRILKPNVIISGLVVDDEVVYLNGLYPKNFSIGGVKHFNLTDNSYSSFVMAVNLSGEFIFFKPLISAEKIATTENSLFVFSHANNAFPFKISSLEIYSSGGYLPRTDPNFNYDILILEMDKQGKYKNYSLIGGPEVNKMEENQDLFVRDNFAYLISYDLEGFSGSGKSTLLKHYIYKFDLGSSVSLSPVKDSIFSKIRRLFSM